MACAVPYRVVSVLANGRPLRHGAALKLADPGTWPAPAVTTSVKVTEE